MLWMKYVAITYWPSFRSSGGLVVNELAFHQGNLHLCPAVTHPVWAQDCKNRPAPFPGRVSQKATKPGSVCPVS